MSEHPAIYFAERLGRMRALTPDESTMLERIVRSGPVKDRRWTRQEDKRLLDMCTTRIKTRLRTADIAEQLGRTPAACSQRLYDLRKRERGL